MNAPEVISHEQASKLLPWLVNESLENAERDCLLAHARDCVICRRELAELRNLRDAIAEQSESESIPAPDMRRINARIDAASNRQNRGRVFREQLQRFVRSPFRIAFAAQTLALIVLATAFLLPAAEEPEFRTLAAPESLPDGHYVRAVFAPDLAGTELAALLADRRVAVVAGPSNRGVYTLRFVNAVSAAEREAILLDLRGSAGVLFAETFTTGSGR